MLGEYFYILNYGNKIDFNNGFIESWVSDNKYSIFFIVVLVGILDWLI